MRSKFTQSEITYKDTRGCGGISVRGIQLEADQDGYIEAPADMAEELAPHGFVPEARKPATPAIPKKL